VQPLGLRTHDLTVHTTYAIEQLKDAQNRSLAQICHMGPKTARLTLGRAHAPQTYCTACTPTPKQHRKER
jgi:hypothetical protein